MTARRWLVGIITIVLLTSAATQSGAAVVPVRAPAGASGTPVGGTSSGVVGTSGSRSFQLPTRRDTASAVHAASAAGNPTTNIPPSPAFPDRCDQAYQSAACTTAAVAALNNARRVMGLPAYVLPANFVLLPPAYQFLALSNADRALAGLTPITAFNATLNSVAQTAANAAADPSATSVPSTIGGRPFTYWTANWAGGMSPLEAYYDWMYDDGYGSNNLDCVEQKDSGCWGHREDTLWNFGAGAEVAMGVGTDFSGTDYGTSWTELYWGYVPNGAFIPRLPAVFSVTPGGPAAGGTTATVTGYGLETANSVSFGSTAAVPVTRSPVRLTVKSPPGTGVAAVRVTAGGGTSVSTAVGVYSYLGVAGPGSFVPVGPVRLLDTRSGVGTGVRARIASKAALRLQINGRGGVPSSGVAAVVLNLSVVNPAGDGFLTAYAFGLARPATSDLNFSKGQVIANMAIVPVAANGLISLYNGSSGPLDLLADVAGYYRSGAALAPGSFTAVAPVRVLDTRSGGVKTRVGAGTTVRVSVTAPRRVPVGATAIVVDVTAVNPAAGGYLTVYGSGGALPTTSNVNFVARQTVANLSFAPIGSDGKVAIFNGSGGPVDVLADLVGYVIGGVVTTTGGMVPIRPTRIFDSRIGLGVATFAPYTFPPPAGQRYVVDAHYAVPLLVSGRGGVPSVGVAAVVLSVSVVSPTAAGFYTVYPDGGAPPNASNLNFVAGQTVPNMVVVPVARNGLINLYNGSTSFNGLIVDVAGYVLG